MVKFTLGLLSKIVLIVKDGKVIILNSILTLCRVNRDKGFNWVMHSWEAFIIASNLPVSDLLIDCWIVDQSFVFGVGLDFLSVVELLMLHRVV